MSSDRVLPGELIFREEREPARNVMRVCSPTMYVCADSSVSVDVTEVAYISSDVPSNRHRTPCVCVCMCMYACMCLLM